jgi:Arc/MetJ-type ribon-helix-helix transcriptional regulator
MPKRFMVNVSEDLYAAADLLRKRRRYRSLSEYVVGLIRYDGQSQRDHLLTGEWAALTGAERDALDLAILRQVESGKGVRGSWLEARIEAIVKAHLAEHGAAPTTQAVASALAQSIPKREE